MQPQFWLDKWEKSAIGFHNTEVHPMLIQHADRLFHSSKTELLVPLCGKSLDMTYLKRKDTQITGIELSELACENFFAENSIPYKYGQKTHGLKPYKSEQITIWQGDYFTYYGKHNSYYDRAALIALPDAMRAQYVKHTRKLLTNKARCLIISLEHLKDEGPPFSLPEKEIYRLYSPYFTTITKLSERATTTPHGDGKEVAYMLETKTESN